MNKGIGLILGLFMFVGCNNTPKKTTTSIVEETTQETQLIGGEKDNQGCLSSAGETWSTLRQTCLRLFDEGIRLNPVTTEDSAVISAFVLLSEDQAKLELFLPEADAKSIILEKKGENIYEDHTYKFDVNEGVLYIDGHKQYAK